MKRLGWLVILLVVASLLLPFSSNTSLVSAARLSFTATSSDCYFSYISGWNAVPQYAWDEAHDDLTEAPVTGSHNALVEIERDEDGSDTKYTISRPLLYFDTAALPDDCTITSATLRLYHTSDFADELGAWKLQVQHGTPP